MTVDPTLNEAYTNLDNSLSYSANVKAFLSTKKSISVHKRKLKRFPRRKWLIPGPFHTIASDIIDYQQYSRANNGFKYILVVLDAFSRFAYTKALKNKTAETTAAALDTILQSMQYPPSIFVCDQGGEYDVRNVHFASLIDKYHISVYYAKGPTKNGMVERYNRTIKTRLQRYFTEKKNNEMVRCVTEIYN